MLNIRTFIGHSDPYASINREERNLGAILYDTLFINDNLDRFLKLVNFPYRTVSNEFGVYLEYAFIRDLWNKIKIKDEIKKRELIYKFLKPANVDELKKMSIREFNQYFGAVPTPSGRFIQSPGTWSISKFKNTIKENETFLKVCKFKWAFNAKPDMVIHASLDKAVCVEMKFESSEGMYPSNKNEKNIFREITRREKYIGQLELQQYLMQDLLGIDTKFVFLVNKIGKNTKRSNIKVLTWDQVFSKLDTDRLPLFMNQTIDCVRRQHND